MPKLSIVITGPVKSGKSSLAELIRRGLTERGLAVTYEDPDGPIPQRRSTATLEHILGLMAERGVEVEITTAQAPREEAGQ